MKWICESCKAINAEFTPKCHNCGKGSPHSALVAAVSSGAEILMTGTHDGPVTKRTTYFLSTGEIHTVVSRSSYSYVAPLIMCF